MQRRLHAAKRFPRLLNFYGLSLRAWAFCLVVPTQQENNPVSMCVAEDTEKDFFRRELLSPPLEDVSRFLAHAELKEASSELTAKFSATHRDAEIWSTSRIAVPRTCLLVRLKLRSQARTSSLPSSST